MKTKKNNKFRNVNEEMIRWILDYSYFDVEGDSPESPIKCRYEPGDDKRFLLLTGDNASGKSFFGKAIVETSRNNNVEALTITMCSRTKGYMKSMIFGDEEYNSTGENSIRTVLNGINTCRNRTQDNGHLMLWDEPDIGLSESFQPAMGQIIGEFVAELPELTTGVVVTTHSRTLALAMITASGCRPHHIRFGDDLSLDDWLAGKGRIRSVHELRNLNADSHDLFRSISKHMKAK